MKVVLLFFNATRLITTQTIGQKQQIHFASLEKTSYAYSIASYIFKTLQVHERIEWRREI